VALTSDLAAILQGLYQKLGSTLADVDFDEQAKRRLFARNVDDLNKSRAKSIVTSNESMADRGLAQSGISLNRLTGINQGYDTQGFDLTGALNTDLSTLAKRRLAAQGEYDLGRADLERQSFIPQAVASGMGGGGNRGGGGSSGGQVTEQTLPTPAPAPVRPLIPTIQQVLYQPNPGRAKQPTQPVKQQPKLIGNTLRDALRKPSVKSNRSGSW